MEEELKQNGAECCDTCKYWCDCGCPRTIEVAMIGAPPVEAPLYGPFEGECHRHAPVVIPMTTGLFNGIRIHGAGKYLDGAGGGGNVRTEAVSTFPASLSDQWCGDYERA